MTEAEWLTSTEPRPMLDHMWGRASDRKFRLFQVACCHRIWDLFPDHTCRDAVLIAELLADGLVSDRKRRAARAQIPAPDRRWTSAQRRARTAALLANDKTVSSLDLLGVSGVIGEAARLDHSTASQDPFLHAYRTEKQTEADLLRDIFGNPFRPVTADPAWLTSTVVQLAREIYDERAFDRLPILADALQDAGCENADVLAHCRGPGPHVRGCWVVDLVLGKS